MKALCWHGKNDIRCDTVPDPKLEDARDVIIKVTACAICGSDLYGGPVSVNMGQVVQKGLTLRSGQTHVKRYLEPLTKLIQEKKIDTTSLISHRSTKLEDGPGLYGTFKDKKDACTKVVFYPGG